MWTTRCIATKAAVRVEFGCLFVGFDWVGGEQERECGEIFPQFNEPLSRCGALQNFLIDNRRERGVVVYQEFA